MLQRLNTQVLAARDLTAAKAWYGRVLAQTPCFDQPFYVGFDIGGCELGLIPAEPGFEPGGDGPRAYWRVADLDACLAHWLAAGAEPQEAPAECDGVRFASVRDPDGNAIGFIQLPEGH